MAIEPNGHDCTLIESLWLKPRTMLYGYHLHDMIFFSDSIVDDERRHRHGTNYPVWILTERMNLVSLGEQIKRIDRIEKAANHRHRILGRTLFNKFK